MEKYRGVKIGMEEWNHVTRHMRSTRNEKVKLKGKDTREYGENDYFS